MMHDGQTGGMTMARIAAIFGTTDGHTAKIVGHVAKTLRAQGHVVDVFDTRTAVDGNALRLASGALIAGSLRIGKFQRTLIDFVRTHREELAAIPTAFLAVSMSAGRDNEPARREVQKTNARFFEETGFSPVETLPVAGALLWSRYGFFTKLAMIFITKMVGGDTDTSRDREYTDWTALDSFALRFAARLEKAAAQRSDAHAPGA
jgi:menaquinone-dependent protoporphyrinogen oxidase